MVRAFEISGVALNLAYTFIYLQGNLPLAYAFAATGALALGFACWKNNLQAETALHAFYLAMAGYGAWLADTSSWSKGIHGWKLHLVVLILGAVVWRQMIPWLKRRGSSMPILDSFTTVFSIVATWLMIHGDPSNWLYWMVIDTMSIYLYAKRGMPWGAFLFAIYSLMAIDGWFDEITWFTP